MTVLIRKKLTLAAATALAALALAGCAQTTTGSANPTTVTPSSATGSAPSQSSAKAPAVKTPLNASKFIEDPCLTLTQAQQQQFEGTKAGRRVDSAFGVGCSWNLGANESTGTSVNFIPTVTNGLTHLYEQNSAGFFKSGYFQPVEVEGYPAVYNDGTDNRPGGKCGLSVGISDTTYFDVLIQGRTGTDGCKAAVNVAKAVLQTIQGGQ
jgi:hypothetical protein